MAKIINKRAGSLVTKVGSELVPVNVFHAPIDDCDCGIFCCGEEKIIRWYVNGVKKQVTLDAIWDLVNP